MTQHGTFMVNGTERVIVSQLTSLAGRVLRPRQGQDSRERQAPLLGPRHPLPRLVDRLRVRPARHPVRPHRPPPEVPRDGACCAPSACRPRTCSTITYQQVTRSSSTAARPRSSSSRSTWSGVKACARHPQPQSNELIVKRRPQVHEARAATDGAGRASTRIPIALEEVLGRVSAHDVKDPKTGEVVLACNEEITEEKLEALRAAQHHARSRCSSSTTLASVRRCATRSCRTRSRARRRPILEIYRRLRPGDPPTPGDRDGLLQQPVLQSRALRSVARRTAQAEPPVSSLDAASRPGARCDARTSSRSCAT